MVEYIDTKYNPGKNDLVAAYYVEPTKGMSLRKTCRYLAAESSIGTWTTISTMNPKIARKLKPKVFSISKKGYIKIAYPHELFEAGNMPGIWSSVAGNIFGMKAVKNLKLMDINFPDIFMKKFKGPKYGIKGIRKMLKVKHRPLCGTIVKPKVGLTAKQHAKVAYESWLGGLDLVKDDENLTSMSFNTYKKRFKLTLKMRDKAEKETGERKVYMANVTADSDEMKKRAKFVKQQGGEYFMVDILTAGWAGLQAMREYNEDLKMAIHAHRAMHGALTRNPKHGISMLTIAKTARLIGVDQLHIGTAAVGKMHGSRHEELMIEEMIENKDVHENFKEHALTENWHNIKPVFAVASGGLSPLMTSKLVKIMGKNIIAQYGGGCHGHPDGTLSGAKAIRQSVEATMDDVPLREYAKNHNELKRAFDKWG